MSLAGEGGLLVGGLGNGYGSKKKLFLFSYFEFRNFAIQSRPSQCVTLSIMYVHPRISRTPSRTRYLLNLYCILCNFDDQSCLDPLVTALILLIAYLWQCLSFSQCLGIVEVGKHSALSGQQITHCLRSCKLRFHTVLVNGATSNAKVRKMAYEESDILSCKKDL